MSVGNLYVSEYCVLKYDDVTAKLILKSQDLEAPYTCETALYDF